MYAIIEDSGSQYKVSVDDVIRVDLRDVAEGQQTIEFDRVLLVGGEGSPKIGAPTVKGAKVTGELLGPVKGEKLSIVKFKRRTGYDRTTGHRQKYLQVKITDIKA